MNKKKLAIGIVAVLALAGLAWAFLPAGEDPQVAKVVELQNKLFSENPQVPPEDRRKAFEELRTEAEKLTEEQRMKMMRDNPPPMMKQFQQHVVNYFDLPQDKRKAELDTAIDEMEKRRKEWEQGREPRRAQGGGPAGAAGGGPRGPGGGGPGGFGRNLDQNQRNQFAKKMLDNTTPQQRAMFGEYFRDLQQRRQERGLPPMGGPFGRL
jgi:hypothetical protein